jgi:hypothetical protein
LQPISRSTRGKPARCNDDNDRNECSLGTPNKKNE